ncbi:gamma-glutamyl-gamma-aminobutyrate hydrolase family protein, partial [Nonomuraea fuscirosea]
MSRPLIGITAYFEAARWGDWVREAVVSPPSYAKAVIRAGGAPVVLPPLGPHAVDDYVRGLRGIVLAGGVELGADTYNGEQDE